MSAGRKTITNIAFIAVLLTVAFFTISYTDVYADDVNAGETINATGQTGGFSLVDGDADVYVDPGESATLHVTVNANENTAIHYQWYKRERSGEDVAIEGETSDTLTTEAIQEFTRYYCIVEDDYGNSDEAWRYVRIDTGLKVSANGRQFTILPGTTQDLVVSATSAYPEKITYSWSEGGEFWEEEEDNFDTDHWFRSIEGEDTDTLHAKLDRGSMAYRCTVSDGYGDSISKYFYVRCDSNLELDYDKNVVAKAGDNISLTVTPSSSVEDNEYTYKWYNADGEQIEDAVTGTLTLNNIQRAGNYSCQVTDKYGYAKDADFRVTIENGFEIQYDKEVSIEAGETAMLKVNVETSDMEGVTYSWNNEEHSTTDTIEVSEEGEYLCIVKDKYNNTEEALINVVVDNNFSVELQAGDGKVIQNNDLVPVQPDGEITLKAVVTADRTDRLSYRWFDDEYEIISNEDSVTLKKRGWSYYECSVKDGYGHRKTVSFRLITDSGFSAAADGEDSFVVDYGEPVTARVKATTNEGNTLTYRWYNTDDPAYDNAFYGPRGTSERTFIPQKSGGFRCDVSDGTNKEEVWFEVKVNSGLKVDYDKVVTAEKGKPITLTVEASSGMEDAAFTYKWYRAHKYEDYYEDEWIFGDARNSLTINKATAGTYACVVSDGIDKERVEIQIVTDTADCVHSTLNHTAGVDATCMEDGNSEYWTCENCGKFFSDEEGRNEIEKDSWVIKALGHDWGKWETVKAATCTETGKQQRVCSHDDTHVETRDIDAMGHTEEEVPAVAATCTKAGLTAGTKCSVCGDILKAQEEVPALGHDWGKWETVKAATCTETGKQQRVCSHDDTHVETRDIDATGHTEEELPAVAATCTKAGLTAGTKCSVCGDILKAQEEIPALGHDWGDWKVTKEATEEEEGLEVRTCKNDPSHTEERAIDKLPPKPNRYLDASDIFWFGNSHSHFGYDDYYINNNDLMKLIDNVRQVYSKYPDFAQSVVNRIRDEQNNSWQGSCYGMAATTILDKQNSIGFNENFDPSAASMNEVQSPSKNAAVKSAINYYFLGQCIPYLRITNNNRYDISKDGWSEGLKDLVSMSQGGKPILFSYFWKDAGGDLYGHAIVIKGFEKSGDGEHHLIAYDNRLPSRDVDITVSSDYSSCVVNGNENATSIEFIQDMRAFDMIDIDGPDNKYQNTTNDKAAGSRGIETASEPQGTNVTVRANGKVSIENAEGQKLDIEDGQTSGNMEVLDRSMIVTTTDTGEDGSMFCFTVADSKAFTFESDQKEMNASVQSENMYGSAETDGADKVTISEDKGISAEGKAYSYDMALSVNNKTCDMVSITGETKEDANLKLVDGKIEATGIDAAAGTVTVFSNDINTDTYTYDKGYSSIMIAPSDSEQAGQIDIMGSSNNDGNYDVTIGGSSEKIDLSDALVTIFDQAFTGRPIAPEQMVVSLGNTRLQLGKDFKALYENNVDVGTATVYIIGTGKYIGMAQGTFNIIKAKNPVNIVKKTIKVKAKSLKKKNLTVAPLKVTGAQGGKSFKAVKWNAKAKKALKLNKKTGKITIRKGTKKSTFRVKVEVTAKGNASYLTQKRNVTVTIRVR